MKTKLYFLLLFICPFSISFSQLVQQTANLDPSLNSWTVPCGVTEIKVEVIGGGGGGGYSTTPGTAAAGGGGGAYAQRVIPVNAGDIFYYNIGNGGAGSSGANAGGDSWFNDVNSKPTVDSPYAILAKGGQGVEDNSLTGATGGSADDSIGAIKRNGGKGGDGKHHRSCFIICVSNSGAGGGAGAGHFTNNGGNGGNGGNSNNGGAGGTSVAPGGNGGNGVGTANHGYPGYIYGGAGGGGKRAANFGTNENGGNGAGGGIKITYMAPSGQVGEIEPAASLTSSAGTELGCSPTPTTLRATGNNIGNGVSTLWFEADPETEICPEVSFIETFTKTPFPYNTGSSGFNVASINGNRINFVSTSANPSINMSNVLVGKDVDPATQRYISFRYMVRNGDSYQPAGKAQIWFLKNGDTGPSSSQMQEVDMISDGYWHIMNIDMHSGPNGANWNGDITGWNFHFATNSGADVLINYMILSDTPLLEYTPNIHVNPGDTLPSFTIPNNRASITIGTYRIARRLVVDGSCSTTTEKTGCRFITLSRTDKKFNIAASSGNWDEGANWSPSGVPTISNCVLIPSGKTVYINSNDAAAKLLTVQNTGKLEILANQSLTVEGAISNNSGANNFIVHDNANLIQVDPTATNTGSIKVTKQVTDLSGVGPSWSYIYWSSPVAGQSLHSFSPGTPTPIGQWGFLEYNEATDYMPHTSDTHFIPGKGYAIRAEAGLGNTYSKPYDFTGVPNNGVITFPLKKLGQGFNLVGNPYPSNIDADVLFAMNTDKIYGTVYLWTNNHPQQYQQGGGYYANTYAIYNGTGGNAATQPADGPGMTDIPNGTISVGQGFLVEAKNNDVDLVFSNINPLNGDLLRVSTAAPLFQKGGKDRFWLKLTSPSQVANTTLIGYINGATDGIDKDFDGEFWGASDAIYSLIENDPYLIQGKSYPLNLEDIVPLGVNIFEEGTYKIELENPEGIFGSEVKVYLRDKLTGREQNLNNQSYKFVIEPGNFEGRFEIFYKKTGFSTTSILNTFAAASQDIFVTKERQNIIILSTKNNILATEVFNIVGLPVYSADNINGKEFRFLAPVNNSQNSILFIKVKDEFGNVSHHKLIMK